MKKLEAQTLDPVGLRGAPLETLSALRTALKTIEIRGSIVTLIADWQDQRDTARYAVLVRNSERSLLSEDAFGGRYGPSGKKALSDLIAHLLEKGAENFKESILAPSDFTRLLEEPDEQHLMRVVAKANPSDPAIYR